MSKYMQRYDFILGDDDIGEMWSKIEGKEIVFGCDGVVGRAVLNPKWNQMAVDTKIRKAYYNGVDVTFTEGENDGL